MSSRELVNSSSRIRKNSAGSLWAVFSNLFPQEVSRLLLHFSTRDFILFHRDMRARDVRQANRIRRRVAEFVRILPMVFGLFRVCIRKKSHDFCYESD